MDCSSKKIIICMQVDVINQIIYEINWENHLLSRQLISQLVFASAYFFESLNNDRLNAKHLGKARLLLGQLSVGWWRTACVYTQPELIFQLVKYRPQLSSCERTSERELNRLSNTKPQKTQVYLPVYCIKQQVAVFFWWLLHE